MLGVEDTSVLCYHLSDGTMLSLSYEGMCLSYDGALGGTSSGTVSVMLLFFQTHQSIQVCHVGARQCHVSAKTGIRR